MDCSMYLFLISSLICVVAKNVIGFPSDDSIYLEQCRPVNFVMGQPGVVNVLAFLDDSWPFSFKQATMLKQLKDRLLRSGFPDIFFSVITISPSPKNNIQVDDNIEKEAWERISPVEAIDVFSSSKAWGSLKKIISPDIFLIEDNYELGIWGELKGARDNILVLDHCGRLTFQVIVPWSILHFPYVKAAILSTYEDNPCGSCDHYPKVHKFRSADKYSKSPAESDVTTPQSPIETDGQITMLRSEENIDDELHDEELLPEIRIIMHAPHYHVNDDSSTKHEYLVLKTRQPVYHGHLDESGDNLWTPKKADVQMQRNIIFDKDESPGLYGEVADFWRDPARDENASRSEENFEGSGHSAVIENSRKNNIVESLDSSPILEDYPESVTNLADFTNEEEETRSKLIAHYSRLLPWINYDFKN